MPVQEELEGPRERALGLMKAICTHLTWRLENFEETRVLPDGRVRWETKEDMVRDILRDLHSAYQFSITIGLLEEDEARAAIREGAQALPEEVRRLLVFASEDFPRFRPRRKRNSDEETSPETN